MRNESHFVSKSSLSYALGRLGDVSVEEEDGAIPCCRPSAQQVLYKAVLVWLGLGFLFECFLSYVCQMNNSSQTMTKLLFPWKNISLQSGLSKELVIILVVFMLKPVFL